MSCPVAGATLRLSGGLEQPGGERLARAFSGPDHELERLIIALRRVEGSIEQRLALAARDLNPARKQQCMTEHHDAVLCPHVEMADPELLVYQRDQRDHVGPARLRDFQIEGAGEMQRLD